MHSGIIGIDHVVIAVRDLARAGIGWKRLGFTLTPRGRHLVQGTANHCIMFAGDYLELLGVVDSDGHADRLQAFLARHEGPKSLAFAPAGSVDEAAAVLARRGLHPGAPRALGRQLELPEGTVVPRFSLIALMPEETPGIESFICGQLTPDLVRRPEWLVHPNGAAGLSSVHVLVGETASLLPAYDRLFGIHQVTTTDAVVRVAAGHQGIVFATPDDFLTMHPRIELDPDFPLPGIVALELAVASRERTADYLTRQQIAFDEMPGGALAVPAREANGTVLLFSAG